MEVNKLLRLGLDYSNPDYGRIIDYNKAIECFEKAAELGSAEAYYYIGDLYYYGFEKVKDYEKAKEYFEKASKLGNGHAMYKLAIMYEEGKGVNQDYKKAFELYTEAIKQNKEIFDVFVAYRRNTIKMFLIEHDKLLAQNNELLKEIELLKAKVLYQPGGQGYLETEQHFNKLINK